MKLAARPALFGSETRTRVLVAVALLESSYPREISRLTRVPLISVQRIVNDLERQGVIGSRLVGRQREVRLNRQYFAAKELRELLFRMRLADPTLTERIEGFRRRPRRAGKEL